MNGVHALVLAAGAGSRFGGGKLMSPWRDGVLLDGALAAAVACGADTVRVVVGIDPQIAPYVAARGFSWIAAPQAAQGLSQSVRAGVESLPADAKGVLVFLGDMPLVPHELARRLVERLLDGAPAAAPLFEGRTGHPVAFAASQFADLCALEGDRGGREILKRLGGAVARVETRDRGVLLDVDRRADIPA